MEKKEKFFSIKQEETKFSSILFIHQTYFYLFVALIYSFTLFIPIVGNVSSILFLFIILFEKSSSLILYNSLYVFIFSWIITISKLIINIISSILLTKAQGSLNSDLIISVSLMMSKLNTVANFLNYIILFYLLASLVLAFRNRRISLRDIEKIGKKIF